MLCSIIKINYNLFRSFKNVICWTNSLTTVCSTQLSNEKQDLSLFYFFIFYIFSILFMEFGNNIFQFFDNVSSIWFE